MHLKYTWTLIYIMKSSISSIVWHSLTVMITLQYLSFLCEKNHSKVLLQLGLKSKCTGTAQNQCYIAHANFEQ